MAAGCDKNNAMDIALEPSAAWLLVSMIFLALEAFGASGVGFLFAALGALSAAILVKLGIATDFWAQGAWFLGASVVWAVALWKPLKNMHLKRGGQQYSNMIGGEAVVLGAGLHKHQMGKVRWSGTTMEARLDANAAQDFLPENTLVTIREVTGNTLIVTPLTQG